MKCSIFIFAVSIALIFATLFIPKPAHGKDEMSDVHLGFARRCITQSHDSHTGGQRLRPSVAGSVTCSASCSSYDWRARGEAAADSDAQYLRSISSCEGKVSAN